MAFRESSSDSVPDTAEGPRVEGSSLLCPSCCTRTVFSFHTNDSDGGGDTMQLRCPECNVPAGTGVPQGSTPEDLQELGQELYKLLCATMEGLKNKGGEAQEQGLLTILL